MIDLRHADRFCDGEIKAVNETYGQGLPEVDLECSKCGQHVALIGDVRVVEPDKPSTQGELLREMNESHGRSG